MNDNNKILPYYRFCSFFDLVPSKELEDRYEIYRDFDDSYRGIDSKMSVLSRNSVNVPTEIVSKELEDRYEIYRDFDDSYRGIDSKMSVLSRNSVNVPTEIV